jgi:hypothetical protein
MPHTALVDPLLRVAWHWHWHWHQHLSGVMGSFDVLSAVVTLSQTHTHTCTHTLSDGDMPSDKDVISTVSSTNSLPTL